MPPVLQLLVYLKKDITKLVMGLYYDLCTCSNLQYGTVTISCITRQKSLDQSRLGIREAMIQWLTVLKSVTFTCSTST